MAEQNLYGMDKSATRLPMFRSASHVLVESIPNLRGVVPSQIQRTVQMSGDYNSTNSLNFRAPLGSLRFLPDPKHQIKPNLLSLNS